MLGRLAARRLAWQAPVLPLTAGVATSSSQSRAFLAYLPRPEARRIFADKGMSLP